VGETETYHRYAEDCRKLAASMKDPEHKKQLEELADAWIAVANGRLRKNGAKSSEMH
jgi:hypothetical protein